MQTQKWQPKTIETYLKKYYGNPESRDTARVYLKHFFIAMNRDPETYHKTPVKQIKKDIWVYAEHIEKRPKKTQSIMLSMLKKYIVRKGIDIKENEWEDIRIRNNLKNSIQTTVQKKTPTQTDLKKILSYADIKSKALFMLCASAGLRIDEALSLTWDKIDLENREILVMGKGERKRISFFTPETGELLKLWKPEREKALQRMYRKSKYIREKFIRMGFDVKKIKKQEFRGKPQYYWCVFKDGVELTKEDILSLDNRVFPFDYVNSQRMWWGLLEKAGTPYNTLDKNEKLQYKRCLYNIHSLRRFWYTQLMSDRANTEYVNLMGGHLSELDAAYKDVDAELIRRKLKQEYDEHMGCLAVFESQPDLTGINQELKAKDEKIKDMERRLNDLEILKELYAQKLDIEKLKNGSKEKKKE